MPSKKKFNKNLWIILIVAIALFLWFVPFLAAFGLVVNPPIKVTTVTDLVNILLDWALQIGPVIATGMIVYAGFVYMTSSGDKAKVGKAKDVLTYAVVGLVIIILAKSIGLVIQSMFK